MKLIALFLSIISLWLFGCLDKRIEYVNRPAPVQITTVIKYDTAGGWVTYIDTTLEEGNIMWMKGYEVTTYDYTGPVHVAFLDENFKPIKYKGLGLIK